MDLSRACRVRTHDDGLNAWEMARMAPTPALQGVVTAYADYAERTGASPPGGSCPIPKAS